MLGETAAFDEINAVPGSLTKDQHYSISYTADRSSATVKILDLDRVRDDRVAFAVTQ